MEKAIEIKRRAQRCIQNGDLDGALSEYEKLVAADDADPYNFVLLADLLYKKGDHGNASQRYLAAASAYEKTGLYKNAIAVCKKMMRLSLSPTVVLHRLAVLHGLDGLTTESALYYMQHAELALREDRAAEAADSLSRAYDVCPENIKALERLAEVRILEGDKLAAADALARALESYQQAGQIVDADRCRNRMHQLGAHDRAIPPPPPAAAEGAVATALVEPPSAAPDEAPPLELDPGPNGEPIVIEHGSTVIEPKNVQRIPGLIMPPASGSISHAPPEESVAGLPALEHPVSNDAPGLRFGTEPAAESAARAPEAAPPLPGAARVEALLARAQQEFRAGEREVASATLVEAACAYDEIGQHDSAATIYRSLSKSAHAGREVMMLWLKNCETRRDLAEAAQVACELGDRALNEGDAPGARGWFQRATRLDASNALAHRRLQRLAQAGAAEPAPFETIPGYAPDADEPAAAPAETLPPAEPAMPPASVAPAPAAGAGSGFEPGRVEVAVGRGEAVTFDLGSLVSEFQRGIEAQISGDAQGHYDLGMTYREMGLLEQAVEAFRTASRAPEFAQRCAEMIGRCMLDQGRFDEAAQEFTTALEMPGVPEAAIPDLRYQLGLSHEAAGRMQEALAEFEQVYSAQANYPDVALKIRVLRKTLENL